MPELLKESVVVLHSTSAWTSADFLPQHEAEPSESSVLFQLLFLSIPSRMEEMFFLIFKSSFYASVNWKDVLLVED